MSIFTGPAFAVESVVPVGLATLRIKYTQDPRVTAAGDVESALTPDNYLLTGNNTNYVVEAVQVDGDPQSIDLFLAAPLDLGTWVLGVTGVVDDHDGTLVSPTSLTFFVSQKVTATPVPGGAVNDPAENVIRRFLNPALKKGWEGMIAALAAGDRINWDNAKLAFDQLFTCSASGKYLEQRAGDYGQKKPAGVDMSDELFRQLAIVSRTRKLTVEAIWEVLEVFYGIDAVRASIVTGASEPYALDEGDDLQLLLDEKTPVSVVFPRGNFQRLGLFSAVEVAAALTRGLRGANDEAFAQAATDPSTGAVGVQVYSGSRGLTSSVRVVGGKAQTKLLFPTSIFTNTGSLPTWNVTLSPTTLGNIRFTWVSGTMFDLSEVEAGDLAYVYGTEFAANAGTGTFAVQAVSVSYSGSTKIQWFEIANPAGAAGSGIAQAAFEDLMFFRPTKFTIYEQTRRVVVAKAGKMVNVIIPATTQVVGRRPGLAAYLNVAPAIQVSSLVRTADGVVTVTTVGNHGLQAGQWVFVDGVVPVGTLPTVTSGTPSGNFSSNIATGTTDYSQKTTVSQCGTFAGINHQAVRLPEGMLMLLGGQTQTAPGTGVTALASPVIFEVTSTSSHAGGAKQEAYKWTNLAARSYTVGHRGFAASLLLDGRVLVTGGYTVETGNGASTNAYDLFSYSNSPAVNSQVSGTMPDSLVEHAQCTLQDGNVLVCGGHLATVLPPPHLPTTNTHYMNPTTLTWTSGGSLTTGRRNHLLVAMQQVQALAIGGYTSFTGNPTNSCEQWDEGAHLWHPAAPMTFARASATAVTLPDGRILVIGGVGYNATQDTAASNPLASCEIYDQMTGQWSVTAPMANARTQPVAAYVASQNAVYVTGGGSTAIEILHLGTMRWRTLATAISSNAQAAAGGVAGADAFVSLGGYDGAGTSKASYIVVPGLDRVRQGGLNREIRVASVPTANTLTFQSDPSYRGCTTAAAGVTLTPLAAPAAPAGIPGPFTYDPDQGLAVTATVATLAAQLNRGQHASVVLDDSTVTEPAMAFPDQTGYLAFDFGYAGVVAPVKYLGRLSETELALDASFRFPDDLPAGTTVTLLAGRGPFTPPVDELVGNLYLTGSAAGRVAAQDTIDNTVAGGLDIEVTVVYPGSTGLGNDGSPTSGAAKLSDVVSVFGGDDLDSEIAELRSNTQ